MMVLDKAKAKAEAGTEFGNKSCFAMWVDPKTIFEPYPKPKSSHSQNLSLNSTWALTQPQPQLNLSFNSTSASTQPQPQLNLDLKSNPGLSQP